MITIFLRKPPIQLISDVEQMMTEYAPSYAGGERALIIRFITNLRSPEYFIRLLEDIKSAGQDWSEVCPYVQNAPDARTRMARMALHVVLSRLIPTGDQPSIYLACQFCHNPNIVDSTVYTADSPASALDDALNSLENWPSGPEDNPIDDSIVPFSGNADDELPPPTEHYGSMDWASLTEEEDRRAEEQQKKTKDLEDLIGKQVDLLDRLGVTPPTPIEQLEKQQGRRPLEL